MLKEIVFGQQVELKRQQISLRQSVNLQRRQHTTERLTESSTQVPNELSADGKDFSGK